MSEDDAVPHEGPDGRVHAATGSAQVDDRQVQPHSRDHLFDGEGSRPAQAEVRLQVPLDNVIK